MTRMQSREHDTELSGHSTGRPLASHAHLHMLSSGLRIAMPQLYVLSCGRHSCSFEPPVAPEHMKLCVFCLCVFLFLSSNVGCLCAGVVRKVVRTLCARWTQSLVRPRWHKAKALFRTPVFERDKALGLVRLFFSLLFFPLDIEKNPRSYRS